MSAVAPAQTGPAAPSDRERQMQELGTAFRRLFRTLNRLRGRDTHLAGTEISHAQFELLLELGDRGPLSAGELAAAARLAPGTVTQMLEHLADSGHVERVRSDSDRRVVVSKLTDAGRRRLEAKHEAWKRNWEHALEGVDGEDLEATTRVLERLGAMFEESSSPGVCGAQPGAERG